MKIISASNKNKVYKEWLKSEIYRMNNLLDKNEIDLIHTADLKNEEDNSKREILLLDKFGRRPILDKIPKNIDWYEIIIEQNDLNKLYILAIWDWFLDTGKTFKLIEVPKSLSGLHGHRISNFPPAADHKLKINEMSKTIKRNIAGIIMICSTISGPYTIIDGTHRSSLLTLNNCLYGTKASRGCERFIPVLLGTGVD